MKIRFLNWVNLCCFFFCIAIAIVDFCTGKIVTGIIEIAVGIFNLFVFLWAVSDWWKTSEKVKQIFIFTCSKCGYKFVPSFWRWIFVPHIFSIRYFKCDNCDHHSWMRRK